MKNILFPMIAAATLIVGTTGCATKRHVQAAIAPVEGRVGEVEKKSKQNGADIDLLHAQTSKLDEKTADVERQAKAAGALAETANGAAGKAQGRADAAHVLATDGIAKTDKLAGTVSEVNGSIDKLYASLDNYKKLTEEVVFFNPSASELSKDAKVQLDALVTKLGDKSKYVVEVRGFTDQTGPAAVNLQLSRQRADAVVRYLTVTHQVPLRRIQQVGAGAESPVADNKTRDGRKQNRRVEVKVFALPDGRA